MEFGAEMERDNDAGLLLVGFEEAILPQLN